MLKQFCRWYFLCLPAVLTLHFPLRVSAQTDTLLNKKRLYLTVGTEVLVSTGLFIGLNELWYADYPRSSFHFQNDNQGWFQMDKIGHTMSAYYTGLAGMKALRWSGVKEPKPLWFGATIGAVFLSAIEYLDGLSTEWGASPGDLIADYAGPALVIGQDMAWHEQRIIMKWSYHNSGLAGYRPSQLGDSWSERWLKDYNGQTYWLSCNLSSFTSHHDGWFSLLNVAIGYGADGMLGGDANPKVNEKGVPLPEMERYRQFYIAPDIDLTRIPTKSRFLKTIFQAVGFLKFPLPAIEYNKVHGLIFHPLCF